MVCILNFLLGERISIYLRGEGFIKRQCYSCSSITDAIEIPRIPIPASALRQPAVLPNLSMAQMSLEIGHRLASYP
jgi:hypothetical protein